MSSSEDGRCACGSCHEFDGKKCGRCRGGYSMRSSSSAAALLSFELMELKDYDKKWRGVSAAIKGFAIGAGIKGGLSLFAILGRLMRRRRRLKNAVVKSASDDFIFAIKESISYGLFLGSFAGTFVTVDELIAHYGGNMKTAKWRALIAGAIAGPSMLLTGPKTTHMSLSIYILTRASVLASRCGIKSKRYGNICKPLTWSHGDIFLMCLSSTQILLSYILRQESLASSYKSFLNKQGGKSGIILQGMKQMVLGWPLTNLEEIQSHYKSITGLEIELDPEMKIPCSIIHGNQSCGGHFFWFLIEAFKRALPIYLPVYLIPAFIVHRQGLLKRQYSILGRGLLGTIRSSLFLSVYCSSAWLWTCILFRLFKTCNVPLLAMAAFLDGLALGIEKKSRRIEISLYCFSRAVESFLAMMNQVGYFSLPDKLKRVDVLVFSMSTAVIMHCYAMERDVFRSKYLNVLDWVFGIPVPHSSQMPSQSCQVAWSTGRGQAGTDFCTRHRYC